MPVPGTGDLVVIMRNRPWASLAVLGVLLFSSSVARASGLSESLRARARSGGTVRVLARLAVPESTSSVPGMPSGDSSRRRAIAGARQRLEQDLGDHGWEEKRAFATIPYVALEVTPEALDRLEASGTVLAVGEDRLERPLLPASVPLVGADQAWTSGYDGTGWTIAVLDTGVDRDHPFLAGKVVSEACYSANGSCPNGQTSQIGDGAGAPCTYAEGSCLHGTHVAGIAAGANGTLSDGVTFSGVARGSNLISIQVFSKFTGSTCDRDVEDPCALTFTSDTIAGLERVYELRDTYRIAAVNMSLGGGSFFSQTGCDVEDAARKAIIDQLRAVGIATVAAAGNEGSVDALSAPACISSVISVGATSKSDEVASFSNSAPFLDLLAPGVRIISAIPPSDYALISGTSQAAPHVAGAFAILKQRLDGGTVDEVFTALRSTGIDVTDPKSGITTPRIRIFDALQSFPIDGPPSGLQVTPDAKRTLVSKDVGGERWAITLNPDDTVTGNVFRNDGSTPQFVWCERTGDDGNPDPYAVELFYECAGAGTCGSLACPAGQWTAIAEVTLPGSFFLPPESGESPSGSAMRVEPVSQDTPSGLQVTPDSQHVIVSKDVAGERWAITRNADDGTVTGNVFPTDGSEPSFVWCEPIANDGNPDPYQLLVTYSCSGADRCVASPCTASQWSFLSEVTLPGSFFLP